MKQRIVMVGERRYRLPFVDLIPFDPKQNDYLGESIRDKGSVEVPIVCWKEKKTSAEDWVVDGAHRVIWAAEHGITKIPVTYRSFATEQEAEEYCRRVNFDRRHVTTEEMKKEREERIERVAKSRKEGKSLRTIAEEEGVSHEQIRQDLSGVNRLTPEPSNGEIQGKDGKVYSANPAKLCPRCKRIGAVANCPKCAELRKQKKPKVPKAKREDGVVTDPKGLEVPAALRDHFGDPWLLSAQDTVALAAEKIRLARLATAATKKGKHFPFFNATKFVELLGDLDQLFDQLVDIARDGRPLYVCPACKGEKCVQCLQAGLIPKWKLDKLTLERISER